MHNKSASFTFHFITGAIRYWFVSSVIIKEIFPEASSISLGVDVSKIFQK